MEKNLPLNYALFTNKQQTTYTKFFKFIKEKITIEPLSVSCDFELAIINSVVDVFPEASVDGCFFHFKKSIWRYIQGNGLATKYCDLSQDLNLVRKYCRMLACLAFAPVEHVATGFVSLQECAPVEPKNLYSYFEENYIGAKKRTKVPS
ncbi:MULE and FLYWCH domain containing, partial [Brachionus plicatilis]